MALLLPLLLFISPSQGKRKANCKAEREVNTKFKEDYGHGRHNVTLSQHENVLTAVTTLASGGITCLSSINASTTTSTTVYEEQKVICRASYPASLDLD